MLCNIDLKIKRVAYRKNGFNFALCRFKIDKY